jgi:phospholipase C
MPYSVEHLFESFRGRTTIRTTGGQARARFAHSGSMTILYPGKLEIDVVAGYVVRMKVEDVEGPMGRPPRPPRWQSQPKTLHCQIEIRTPDGNLFTGTHVTSADISRFRDLRGVTRGAWTYKVSGESAPVPVDEDNVRVEAGNVFLRVRVVEAVTSKSAPPFVNENLGAIQHRRYGFDLWRVGTFTATARSGFGGLLGRRRAMKLRNPDGTVVAESANGRLNFPVTLRTLDQSRDAEGKPRPWSLEVMPSTTPGLNADVWASVVASARIGTTPLLQRLTDMIGARGNRLRIFGETDDTRLFARLEILDDVSAALFDRYKILKKVLTSVAHPEGVEPGDVKPNTIYNLANKPREFGGGFKVHLFGMKISAIDISIGNSVHIQPSIPALKVSIGIQGSAKVEYKGIGLANASIRNNRIDLEIGLRLGADGTFSLVSWISDDPLDADVANDALLLAIAAGLVLGGLTVPTVLAVGEYLENEINGWIAAGFQRVLDSAGERIPEILAMVLGDDFTYRALRFEGSDIVFDYAAPLEPDPKPSSQYRAVIGRSADQLGPQTWMFRPPTLGNTWATDNLSKIDHIVMVMMENRSFDHVLGYIARTPAGANSNGLSSSLTDFLASQDPPHKVLRLKDAGIVPNGVDLKTKFPAHVGHSLADVTEQLSERLATPSGPTINSPVGFKRNFEDRVTGELVVDNVLGYYEADDLAFYKFLTDNYGWCERYHCSHAGPTLPNRMYSIAGDVQYDRGGEAILDNNKGENFALSRATTIFDLLTRKGVGWRVYESYPSVTMLRFFARYATDTTNIVDISRLAQDIASGNLPAVTFIDPAMHHDPQNDDHPIADMYRGQIFLKGIYDALRANEALWRKTLLIITYDEHGGFYDHVVPPLADIRQRPMVFSDGGPSGPPAFTPDTILTSYGVRVPTFVVSPWVPAGKGTDIVLDHCSILKTILARFCGQSRPFLSDRVHASRTLEAYLTATAPRLEISSPAPLRPLPADEPLHRRRMITTEPVFNRQMRAGNVDSHDLMGMLARMLGRDSQQPIADNPRPPTRVALAPARATAAVGR